MVGEPVHLRRAGDHRRLGVALIAVLDRDPALGVQATDAEEDDVGADPLELTDRASPNADQRAAPHATANQ